MRELAVQAANDTLTSQDRSYLQKEIDELRANIDKVASSTQFNTKRLLDGSLCGSWSSTDNAVKAYIRGAIETEGNYRIEVKANPGAAQVQKSNIFKIKHENVVTNLQLNSADGFEGMSIDGLPAGDYNISTSKGAGGDIVYIYNPVLEGNVPEPAGDGTIPADETMYLTFKSEKGNTAYMSFDLAKGLDQKGTAKAIVDTINEKGSITVNDHEITLEASLNADEVSYSVKASGKEHITSLTGSASLKPLDRVESVKDLSESSLWDRIHII